MERTAPGLPGNPPEAAPPALASTGEPGEGAGQASQSQREPPGAPAPPGAPGGRPLKPCPARSCRSGHVLLLGVHGSRHLLLLLGHHVRGHSWASVHGIETGGAKCGGHCRQGGIADRGAPQDAVGS